MAKLVNVFEQWESDQHLAAWRSLGGIILGRDMQNHQITTSGPVFD
jgi:hypothetical protein